MEEKDENKGSDSPFDKFKNLSKRLVHVPKKEVDRKEKAQRAKKRFAK
ncbi:MAG: hypothetical protein NTZ09_07630 [Candidatus Hydrogenedentes bacterium]|nr:hypothetical protein [Candidatus Hydrogenedentota bacterium]